MSHPIVELHRARRSLATLALFLASIHSAGAEKVRHVLGAESVPPVAQELSQQRKAAEPARSLLARAIQSCMAVRDALHEPTLDATIKELTGAQTALDLLEQCWAAEENAHEDLKAFRSVIAREASHLQALEHDTARAREAIAVVDHAEADLLARQGFDGALTQRSWDAWSENGLALRVLVDAARGRVWPIPREFKQHIGFVAALVGKDADALSDEDVAPFVPAIIYRDRDEHGPVCLVDIGTPSMKAFSYDYRATAVAKNVLRRFIEGGDLGARYALRLDTLSTKAV